MQPTKKIQPMGLVFFFVLFCFILFCFVLLNLGSSAFLDPGRVSGWEQGSFFGAFFFLQFGGKW